MAPASSLNASLRYQTLWRWHFYAALFVMPLLLILSLTGTLYVFQPQVENWLYKDLLVVPAPPHGTLRHDYTYLAQSTQDALPPGARLLRLKVQQQPERSVELVYQLESGSTTSVYLNPYSAEVLGVLDINTRFIQQVRMLHRQLLLGGAGGIIMELAATWTFIMLATGMAMWWLHRGAHKSGLGAPPSRRLRWRKWHTLIGVWAAAGAVFFVLSGMPWSASWGSNFKAIATYLSFGYPEDRRAVGHLHSAHKNQPRLDDVAFSDTPWAVGYTRVPFSVHPPPAGIVPISLDEAVARLKTHGLHDDYELAVPQTDTGVYSVAYYPADPRGQRTIHLDAFSGAVISDTGYADYGAVAKAISFGTALHLGRLYGWPNQLVCALLSLALAALSLSGLYIGWMRRPWTKGLSFARPKRMEVGRISRTWVVGLALLGLIFPLMGISLIAVALLDYGVARVNRLNRTS